MTACGRGFERWVYWQVTGERAPRAARRPTRGGPARSADYRAWIRKQPSCLTGAYGCEAAHTGDDGGMSQKASDLTCVPLTAVEHREYHSIGRAAMERKYGVSFSGLVEELNQRWRELK